jgi:hypothetical protein
LRRLANEVKLDIVGTKSSAKKVKVFKRYM